MFLPFLSSIQLTERLLNYCKLQNICTEPYIIFMIFVIFNSKLKMSLEALLQKFLAKNIIESTVYYVYRGWIVYFK
jgi:hypothetical protein